MTTKGLIDFHCHLDLYDDFPQVVTESDRAGIFTLAVTTTPRAFPRNQELASATKFVRAALGLHPQQVERRANEIGIWEQYLSQTRYIGEVGLDASPRHYRSFELQKQIFRQILRACADAGDKILTVHSVRSSAAVLDMIDAELPNTRGRVVLHWFSGTKKEAERAIALGCYFSINKEMLRDERRRALVDVLPLNRLLTETDGPFVETAGRAIRPKDVIITVEALAALKRMGPDQLSAAMRRNLRRLVSE
jgi:TatD DNase family protein